MILERLKLTAGIRFDKVDLDTILKSCLTDSNYWHKNIFSEKNYILNGFTITGIGSTEAVIDVTSSALLFCENSSDYSYNVVNASSIPILSTDLESGTINYVEIQLVDTDSTPEDRVFLNRDTDLNGVTVHSLENTQTSAEVDVVINQRGFSRLGDTLPICTITTDVGGIITAISDQRNLFFRLDNPTQASYSLNSKIPNVTSVVLSGVTGTFALGETVTFSGTGTATAKVTFGGTTYIEINLISSDSFFAGDTLTSASANGTVVSMQSSFRGADSDIGTFKDWMDAIGESFKEIKGSANWYDSACLDGVDTGAAGYASLYPSTGIRVDDTYVQNTKNVSVKIADHSDLASDREYTVPDATDDAEFIMTEGNQTLSGEITLGKNLEFIATDIVAEETDCSLNYLIFNVLYANKSYTFLNPIGNKIRLSLSSYFHTAAFPTVAWDSDIVPDYTDGEDFFTKLGGVSAVSTVGLGTTVDSAGNSYVCGYTSGALAGRTLTGSTDAFVSKYNSAGTHQWTRLAGTAALPTQATGVAVDSSGNVFVTGWTTEDLTADAVSTTTFAAYDYAAFVIKYNSSGTVQWIKLSQATGKDAKSYGISINSADTIYITGETDGDLNGETLVSGSTVDSFIVKYANDGTLTWTKLAGVSGATTIAYGIHANSADTSISIVGKTNGNLNSQTKTGTYDSFIIKYNNSGTVQWTKLNGVASGTTIATAVIHDSSNNIAMVGNTNGNLNSKTLTGTVDAFGVRYNSSGTKYATELKGVASIATYATGISLDFTGNYTFMTGYTSGDLGGAGTLVGTTDSFIMCCDSYFNINWTRMDGLSGKVTKSNGIALSSFDDVFIAGYTTGAGTFNGETITGTQDYFLTEYKYTRALYEFEAINGIVYGNQLVLF